MKRLLPLWRRLALWIGWQIPSDVAPGYPQNLADFRARKAALEASKGDPDVYALRRDINRRMAERKTR